MVRAGLAAPSNEVEVRQPAQVLRVGFGHAEAGTVQAGRTDRMLRLSSAGRGTQAPTINPKTAVEMLPDGPSSSAASVCAEGICHPLGETRRSWKSKAHEALPIAPASNRRF
jgi:hypothetical protein